MCYNLFFTNLHAVEIQVFLNRGSYMSVHVLLNLSNELGKKIRSEALPIIINFIIITLISLINSIIQEHECKILFII